MPKKITEDGEIVDVITHEPVARPPIFWKTPWNHDTDEENRQTATYCLDPSKTQQQFKDETDINHILRKFMSTGELPQVGVPPRYMDIQDEQDLQSRMVTGYQVQEAWDALPAAVRNQLRDPKTFADYVTHCLETGDLDPLVTLGLAKPPTEPVVTSSTGGTPAPAEKTPAPAGDKAP